MFSRDSHSFWSIWNHMSRHLTLVSLVLAGMLVGCQPDPEPTLPPATMYGPQPATAMVPKPPTATPLKPAVNPVKPTPTKKPTPTSQPTVEPTVSPLLRSTELVKPTSLAEPAEPVAGRQAVALTILHTNDVMGEIDPCG